MKEIKKPILRQIAPGESVKKLLAKGDVRLNLGNNIINVVKDGKILRRKVVLYTGEESKVQQSFAEDTDIKNILQKYGRTGILPINKNPGLYGDFSDVPDYQEACNIKIKAEQQFALLSAEVRKRFDNDPAKMLEFCGKEENLEEMRKLGLAEKAKPAPEPIEVKVTNPAQAEGE